MTSEKDRLFWNALKKSKRVHIRVLGCVVILLGVGVVTGLTGVGWWLLNGLFANGGKEGFKVAFQSFIPARCH